MNITPMSSGDRAGGDQPHRDAAASSGDVLEDVLARLGAVEASPSARVLIAQVLAATLVAFTRTSSVRDPLPDTASDSAEEALAVLAGIDHLRASLAAVDATWQVAAEQRIRLADAAQGVAPGKQGKGAGQEIALARRISPAASSFSQAKARRLVQNMPGTVDRLWAGAVTDRQASAVAGALDGASAETCRQIDEQIREHPESLRGKGHKRLQDDIRAMVQRLEPETSRERAERAARTRHVHMTPLNDGMARVTAVLRGIDAVAMMHSLQTRAESLRATGEKASVPALEADLLVGDVLHSTRDDDERHAAGPQNPRPRPGLDVGIVITDTALLGPEDDAETAQLEGYGTIPAHIVRDTLLGQPPGQLRPVAEEHPDELVSAFYRRLYATPRTGDLVAMESRSRAFPAGLARMLRWRDTTCRTPWCNAKIRHNDHVIPHHRGGATSFANGQGLCARCNLLKELGLWVLTPLSRAQNDRGIGGAAPTQADGTDPVESDGATPAKAGDVTAATPDGTASVTPDGTAPADAEGPDPEDVAGTPAPPSAWIWSSPHGATGISPTPPLITPRPEPPAAEEPADDTADDDPTGPAPPPGSPFP